MTRSFLAAVAISIFVALAIGLYESGLIRFNYPSRTEFPIRGIDVSHHQGVVDWDAVRNAGFRFAFIKASEGSDYRDRQFERNWAESSRAGLARGAYHFFTFCSPGAAQAEHLLTTIGSSRGELPLVVDDELSGNCTRWTNEGDIRRELRTFLETIEKDARHRPILYYTRDAYSRIIKSHFDDYPRWPRNILQQPDARWLFWQFADNGRVAGIQTLVDLNVFAGSPNDFEQLLQGSWPEKGTK